MPIETAATIKQLNPNYPASTDMVGESASHIRLIKRVLQEMFPNLEGPLTATAAVLNNPFDLKVGSIIMWGLPEKDIPGGWALCDGRTVARSDGSGNITTPDMTGIAPIGAGPLAALGVLVGATTAKATTTKAGQHKHDVTVQHGGKHSHTATVAGTALNAAHMPAHDHFVVAKGINNDPLTASTALAEERTAGGDTEYRLMGAASGAVATAGKTSSVGSGSPHTHDATVSEAPDHTHAATSADAGEHEHEVTVSTVQPSRGIHFIMKV